MPPRRTAMLLTVVTALGGVVPLGTGDVADAATPGVRIDPDPVAMVRAPGRRDVLVRWSGLPANVLVVVDICRRSIDDPAFDVTDNCSTLSRLTPNGTPSGAGQVALEVFRGPNPDGETPWGCYAAGEAPPDGIEGANCFVRVTHDSVLNMEHDVETPLRFVDGPEGRSGTSGPALVRPTPLYSDAPAGGEDGDGGVDTASDSAANDRAELLAGATMAAGGDGLAGLAAVG